MSNPNGSSSVKDLKICMFFTELNEIGELEVSEKTVNTFNPNDTEYIQIPTSSYVIGNDGTRTTDNGDVYEKNRGKIVRTLNRVNNDKSGKSIRENEKEDKKRA